uniref:Histone deacetylase 11 n=1 Tax=Canis lupus familiaris TaxID=9615 RepID=A0A8C0NIX5_CANLF
QHSLIGFGSENPVPSFSQVTGTWRALFKPLCPSPSRGPTRSRPRAPSRSLQGSQLPCSWQPSGQLLVWLEGTAGPTERPIVSVFWGSVVGASSHGPAPGHLPLSLGGPVLTWGLGGTGSELCITGPALLIGRGGSGSPNDVWGLCSSHLGVAEDGLKSEGSWISLGHRLQGQGTRLHVTGGNGVPRAQTLLQGHTARPPQSPPGNQASLSPSLGSGQGCRAAWAGPGRGLGGAWAGPGRGLGGPSPGRRTSRGSHAPWGRALEPGGTPLGTCLREAGLGAWQPLEAWPPLPAGLPPSVTVTQARARARAGRGRACRSSAPSGGGRGRGRVLGGAVPPPPPPPPPGRGAVASAGRAGPGMPHTTQLYQHVPETRWPIVYSPRYNITFMGLEKLHPFDAGKWGKVISFLKEEKLLSDGMLVEAREASDEDLLVVHTRRYLNELKWSFAVATITEIPPVIFLPNFLVQRKVLKPLRTQTGGTIMVEASTTAPVTGAGASAPTRTSHWPSSFCSSEWRASPEPPSLILMPIRAMDMNGTSWVTSVCTSWMSTTGTSTLGTALPSRPSGGRWSWNGVRRMMSTWIKWSGTCRRPSKSTCPTSWCTTRVPTSSRVTALGGCPSAHRCAPTPGGGCGVSPGDPRQQEGGQHWCFS